MPQFLTFALVAPIASFGGIAVGERRPSWDRPARSAVLGLVGACLGVERGDSQAQAALAQHYGLGLLCHAPGRLLADYHTAQVPPSSRKRSFATRAEELASPDLATILSRRDYRSGAWHIAALWSHEAEPRWSLKAIAGAMRAPAFTLCLGRKSCPLGLPLAPSIDEAPDPATVLARRHVGGPEMAFRGRMAEASNSAFIARDEWNTPDASGIVRTEFRRDQPRSRTLWQFDLRREVVEALPQGEPAA